MQLIVQFRIHQNRWIKIQKTYLYRVNLNLKRCGENSHLSVHRFLLVINTFLLVFVNIFLQLEANPVQTRLLHFYPVVLVNSKLDHYMYFWTEVDTDVTYIYLFPYLIPAQLQHRHCLLPAVFRPLVYFPCQFS